MTEHDEIYRLQVLLCEQKSNALTFYEEIERLRADLAQRTAERDEARCEVCLLRAPSTQPSSIASYAIERKWDCFKEVQP